MANYSDYKTLISQAISDFDSIFNALKAKGVKYQDATLTSADAQYGDAKKYLPTSEYANLIGQLSLVGGTELSDFTGAQPGGTLTLTPGTNKVDIDLKVINKGVYEVGSSLTSSFATVDKQFTALSTSTDTALEKVLAEDGKTVTGYKFKSVYTGTPSILNSVSVSVGKIGTVHASADTSKLTVGTATISLGTNQNIGDGIAATTVGEDEAANYVGINLKSSGQVSGTLGLTGVTLPEFSEGYIESADSLTADALTLAAQTVSGDGVLYIKKTTIEKVTGTGVISLATDQTSMIAGADEEGYELTVKAGNTADDTGKVTASKAYTEGYLTAGTAEAEITIPEQTFKIRKGSLVAAADAIDVTPGISYTNVKTTEGDSQFTITVADPLEEKDLSSSLVLTKGYIDTTTIPTPNVTANSQTIKLASGSISASVNVKEATITGDTSIFATPAEGEEDKYYKITPSATASVSDATVVEGYVKNADQISITNNAGTTAVAGTAKYIAKGSVAASADITLTADGDADHSNAISLEATAPTSGHFYKLDIAPSVTINAGYVAGTEKTENHTYKYIKEAVLEYVTSETDGAFIQIKQGGYVPSGLVDIKGITTGTPDYASVTIGTNSSLVTQTAPADLDNYVSIPLTKTINAGYISEKNGTVTASALYMAKAKVTTETALSDAADDWTQGAVETTETGYKLSVSGKTTASATITAGYVEAATKGYASSATFTKDVTLEKAVLGVSGEATVKSTPVAGISTDATSKYTITSTLDASALSATVTKVGYAGTDVSASASIDVGKITTATVGIKAGTGVRTQDANVATVTLEDNFDTSVAAGTNYTIAVKSNSSVSATAELNEGYYGSDEKEITATKKVTGSISVAHGKLSSTVSTDKLDVTTDGLVTYSVGDKANAYIDITPTIGNITVGYSLTAGYIKTADLDGTSKTLAITNTVTKKLRKYGKATTYIDATTQEETVAEVAEVYGSHTGTVTPSEVITAAGITEDLTIKTAGTYVEEDIFIPLSANAAGVNVVTDLTRLSNRLAGKPLATV